MSTLTTNTLKQQGVARDKTGGRPASLTTGPRATSLDGPELHRTVGMSVWSSRVLETFRKSSAAAWPALRLAPNLGLVTSRGSAACVVQENGGSSWFRRPMSNDTVDTVPYRRHGTECDQGRYLDPDRTLEGSARCSRDALLILSLLMPPNSWLVPAPVPLARGHLSNERQSRDS